MRSTANAELAKLQTQRSRAASRIAGLESQWRDAVEASRLASGALTELERNGGSATSCHAAEEKLADAKQLAGEPWAERISGAKAAARDVDRRYREHIAEHLGELLDELEADRRVAAERVNAAAADLNSAHVAWQNAATEISATIALVGQLSTADVRRSRPEADEAARAAIALVGVGGERGPQLDRQRPPWSDLPGDAEAVDADAVLA